MDCLRARAVAAALVMAVSVGSALAQDRYFDHDINQPMRFMGAYIGNAAEFIIAEGEITSEAPEAFREFLDREQPQPGLTVTFNSHGGSLMGGIKLGEMIRERGLTTSIGKTTGTHWADDRTGRVGSVAVEEERPGVCMSSCAYAFLGGVRRSVPEDATLGVHQHADTRSLNDPLAKSADALDRSFDQMAPLSCSST